MFSSTVVARTSYTFNEIVFGAKFKPMFNQSIDNQKTILHLDKLDSFETIDISHINKEEQVTG